MKVFHLMYLVGVIYSFILFALKDMRYLIQKGFLLSQMAFRIYYDASPYLFSALSIVFGKLPVRQNQLVYMIKQIRFFNVNLSLKLVMLLINLLTYCF